MHEVEQGERSGGRAECRLNEKVQCRVHSRLCGGVTWFKYFILKPFATSFSF